MMDGPKRSIAAQGELSFWPDLMTFVSW